MKFCRLLLILAVSLLASSLALLAIKFPGVVVVVFIVWCTGVARKGYRRLTAHGTARWCDADDLRAAGMLDADSGLILGRITDSGRKPWAAIKALFDRRLDPTAACEMFLGLFRRPQERMVRLANAVHTAVFAPTGVGKGV